MLKNKIIIIYLGILALSFGSAIYADMARHDPTQPLPLPGITQSQTSLKQTENNPYDLKIDLIIINKNSRVASINGQRLQVGDKIDNVTVVAIDSQSVRMKDNIGEFTISLPYSNMKTPANNISKDKGKNDNDKKT
jgi:hypothetical protein